MLVVGNAVSRPETIRKIENYFDAKFTTPAELRIFLTNVEKIEVLWIHFDTYLDETYLKLLLKVKFIISTTTGSTHICEKVQEQFGKNLLTLKNEKFLNTISSTAELTWTLLMHSNFNLQKAIDSVKKGEWDRQNYLRTTQLRSRKLGIVGYGRLGKMVAKIAKGFSMKVIVYDRKLSVRLFARLKGFKTTTSLEKLVNFCDILSLHADYELGKQPILNSKVLNSIKQPMVIINTARAGLVDEQEILKLIESGKDIKYFCDVLESEEKNSLLLDSKLWKYSLGSEKVVITPHIGGANLEAMDLCEINLLTRILHKFEY